LDCSQLYYNAILQDGSPLPDWLQFYKGVFSGTPKILEILLINLFATDNQGGNATASFSLTVKQIGNSFTTPQPNGSIPEQFVTIGNFCRIALPRNLFINPTEFNLTYSADLNTDDPLPSWLVFSS